MGTRISSIIGRSGWSFDNIRDAISILGMHLDIDWMKSSDDLLKLEVSGTEGYCLERIIDYLLRSGQFYLQQVHIFSSAGGDWIQQLYSMENQNASYSREMTNFRRNTIKIISQVSNKPFKGLGLFYFFLDKMIETLCARNASPSQPLLEENAYTFVSLEEKEVANQLQSFLQQFQISQLLVGEREELVLCLCQHLHSLQNLSVASQYLVAVMEAGVNDPLIYYNYFVIASTMQDWDVAFQGYKIACDAMPRLSFVQQEYYTIEQIVAKNRFYISFYGQYREKRLPILIKAFFQPPESVKKAIAQSSELNHQGIITLFDWYEISPSRACLVMEYLQGPLLDAFINQQGPLEMGEFLQASLQILGAMAYAHDHEVVHGALDPSKIVFDNGNLKIVDFGIYPLEAWPIPATRENLLYTSFIAPELLMYKIPPDKVCDVYSLGMILYYLITGSAFGIKHKLNIPATLLAILERATHPDPKERYANATELMMDIAHLEEIPLSMPVQETKVPLEVKSIPAQPKEIIPKSISTDILLPEGMVWQNDSVYSHVDDSLMVAVPAGFFSMGSQDRPTESPVHEVYLDTYLIDKYPVTNGQYARFLEYMQKTQDHSKCHADEMPGKDHTPKDWQTPKYMRYSEHENSPVIFVDWWDAWAYASWAGKTLPSEAQWEKAARGADGRKYPWGNEEPNKSLANYNDEFGCTSKVNSFPQGASPYGCFDMAGNVWEWCIDTYDKDFYKESPAENPACVVNKPARSSRGGSWNDGSSSLRTSTRGCWINMVRYAYIGFRCVRILS
ncbi:MAG: SUMF1/EgtB/PvdO family nonheme iron enzyme [Candidatus Brocadiae bacterium]|nr:SUMF1/EgtB/PvdO family nonheme iron enzyme [Candidatus Brocadiia bacterium]